MSERPSIAIIIVSRNRPDLVERSVKHFEQDPYPNKDILVVECGSDAEHLTTYPTLCYPDEDFKGKCFGHNLGLNYVNMQKQYDYYLFCMNDVYIDNKTQFLAEMIEVMEHDPKLGVLSPTEKGSDYPGARPQGIGVRPVTTSDYLFLCIRGEVVRQFGFLNHQFKYCWGAIHEYSYKLYANGWYLAYYDFLDYVHLGGTTYGNKSTKTISREAYLLNAKRFAREYFVQHYGDNWDQVFWDTASKEYEIDKNTYKAHRLYWERVSE